MPKYIYPAIFKKEKTGYSVSFPDIKGCFTQGESLQESFSMASDALCLILYTMEEDNISIPNASDISKIKTAKDEFVSYVTCDTLFYRQFHDNKAVKKTLTIPSWLNTMSERAGINFSATLQAALKKELHIS